MLLATNGSSHGTTWADHLGTNWGSLELTVPFLPHRSRGKENPKT
jgi:hypothetical protein